MSSYRDKSQQSSNFDQEVHSDADKRFVKRSELTSEARDQRQDEEAMEALKAFIGRAEKEDDC